MTWFSEKRPSREYIYHRVLPGGGFIAIATEVIQPLFAPSKIRGRVIVERRSEERRLGHETPIAAVAERDDVDSVVAALMPIAESDETISQTLARRVTIPVTRKREPPNS